MQSKEFQPPTTYSHLKGGQRWHILLFIDRYCVEYLISSSIFIHCGKLYEPVHEISNNVVYATSKGSDQPAHARSLIRAFASLLSIL